MEKNICKKKVSLYSMSSFIYNDDFVYGYINAVFSDFSDKI